MTTAPSTLMGEASPPGGAGGRFRLSTRIGQAHPLLRFVARRVAAGFVLLFVVSVTIFVAVQVLPGDAATAVLGRNATPQSLAAIRAEMRLDRPAYERYLSWLNGVLHGDFGRSLTSQSSVWSTAGPRFANTLVLAFWTSCFLFPLALALGVWTGTHVDRLSDQVLSVVSLLLITLPEFVLGSFLIVGLSLKLRLLPPVSLVMPGQSALANPRILALPVATLVCVGVGYLVRLLRAGVVETMASDYVQTARLNGVFEWRVIFNYGLRNALAPSVQAVALTLQWLIGGIFIVETLFGYPGIGQGLVQAVIARDFPYVESVGMLLAALYIAINIVADLVCIMLVPKLRTAA